MSCASISMSNGETIGSVKRLSPIPKFGIIDLIPSPNATSSHPQISPESSHLAGKEAAKDALAINSFIIKTMPFHIATLISVNVRGGIPCSLSEKYFICFISSLTLLQIQRNLQRF